MKLIVPPVKIDKEDPFKYDVLHRRQFGTSLLNLVSRIDEAFVISIDAQWGEGKTTFVKMWQGLLHQNDIQSIYFDAFANDFVDDPFIAVASEIAQLAEDEFRTNKSRRKKLEAFKKSASIVGGQLLTLTAKVAIKAATLGAIKDSDFEELKEIKDDLAKGASDIFGKLIEDRISSYKGEVESITAFQSTLKELAAEINKASKKPLVIIIDELDRCKPTYAVELVEKIKHLFAVENVVFCLVMHKAQLEESVRCVYGQNIDANTYLKKFIHLECALPKTIEPYGVNDYEQYCQHLHALLELETTSKSDLIDSLVALSQHRQLSLRQLERAFTLIAIFYGSINENTLRLSPVIAFLAITKVLSSVLYADLKANKASWDDAKRFLGFPDEKPAGMENRRLFSTGQWIKFFLLSKSEYEALDAQDEIRLFERGLQQYQLDRNRIIPLYCSHMDVGWLN